MGRNKQQSFFCFDGRIVDFVYNCQRDYFIFFGCNDEKATLDALADRVMGDRYDEMGMAIING